MRPPDRLRATSVRRVWARSSLLAPGAGLAVLAKFTCSACVAVYAGVLSSLGLGFAATDRGLMGLTVFFLAVGTASIAWSARRYGQWRPLVLAAAGALLVVVGRIRIAEPFLYGGTACIIVASLWNLWLGRRSARRLVQLTVADSSSRPVLDRPRHSL